MRRLLRCVLLQHSMPEGPLAPSQVGDLCKHVARTYLTFETCVDQRVEPTLLSILRQSLATATRPLRRSRETFKTSWMRTNGPSG